VIKNGFSLGDEIEFVGPNVPYVADNSFALFDTGGDRVGSVTHHSGGRIRPSLDVEPGFLIRQKKQ
jgi:hypothetical protein